MLVDVINRKDKQATQYFETGRFAEKLYPASILNRN